MTGLTAVESQFDPWHITDMTDQAPKHPKRPRDPAQLAKLIVDIATGEVEDRDPTPEERAVDPGASAMGRKGGPARAASMSPERRSEIAKAAAAKRWKKSNP
jgi:hypothetical protein